MSHFMFQPLLIPLSVVKGPLGNDCKTREQNCNGACRESTRVVGGFKWQTWKFL